MNDSPAKPRNILIIKPSALGDIALSLPALASLRASFPDARITWLVRSEFAPLLSGARDLDDIILFDRKLLGKWWCRPHAFKAFTRFLRALRDPGFDLVIDLQGLFRTAFFAWMTAAPMRIGMKTAREFATIFYTRKVPPPEDSFHVVDYCLKIAHAAGAETVVGDYDLLFAEDMKSKAARLLADNGVDKDNFVVLMVGSAHSYKCWPIEKFAQLADMIARDYNTRIVAVGTAGESPAISQLCSLCETNVADLSSRTDIPSLACLLENARLVISNDTGPGHMAVAMNTPVVIVFGPTNPTRVGPYKKPDSVAAVDPDSRGPAIESKDPAHSINRVTVEHVFALARRHLDRSTH